MFRGASNLVFTGGNFNVKPEEPPSPIQSGYNWIQSQLSLM